MVLPEQLSFRTAWPVVLDLVLITSTSSSCGSTPWTLATSYFPPCPVLYVTAVFTVGSLESRQSRHIEERPLLGVALSHRTLSSAAYAVGLTVALAAMSLSLPVALETVDKNTREDNKGRHVWCLVVAVGLGRHSLSPSTDFASKLQK